MDQRTPVATDAEGARAYLGCSQAMFDELRARRIIRPLRKNWYSFDDLDLAVSLVRKERDLKLQLDNEGITQTVSRQTSSRNLGGKGGRSDYPKTKDLLREIS